MQTLTEFLDYTLRCYNAENPIFIANPNDIKLDYDGIKAYRIVIKDKLWGFLDQAEYDKMKEYESR